MTFPYLSDTATRHLVHLNGNPYVVVGAADIQEQPAAEFAVQVAQGPPSQDTRENLSYWTMANWTPGLGIKFGDFREHMGRFWWSTLDTRWPNQLTLAPLRNTLGTSRTSGQVAGYGDKFSGTEFIGLDYFGLVDKVWLNTAGTLTEAVDMGTVVVTMLHTFSGGGTERIYAAGNGRFYSSTDGASWLQSDAGIFGYWFLNFDNKLIKAGAATGAGRPAVVSQCTTGTGLAADYTTLVDLGPIAAGGAVIGGLVAFRNENGPTTFFLLQDNAKKDAGLYDLDVFVRKATPVELDYAPRLSSLYEVLAQPAHNQPVVLNDKLYVPMWDQVMEWQPGSARFIGPDVDQGLPAGYGLVHSLVATRQQLLAVAGTTAWAILSYNGVGWHVLYTSSVAIRGLYISGAQAPQRLYWAEQAQNSTTGTIYYLTLPISGGENPINDSASTYAASGILITPWVDGGFADLDKLLLKMRIRAENLANIVAVPTTGAEVLIEYQLDDTGTDGGTWTTLGTFDAASDILYFGSSSEGVGCRSWRLRITLSRGTTTTTTPIVRALTLDFLVTPDYRAADSFWVDIGETIKHRGEPWTAISTILAEFETAYEANTLVSYAWGDDTASRVKVVSYKSSLWDLDVPDPKTGAIRNGLTQVQIMDVIA